MDLHHLHLERSVQDLALGCSDSGRLQAMATDFTNAL